MHRILEGVYKVAPQLNEAIDTLAEQGWYINRYVPYLLPLLAYRGKRSALTSYFEQRATAIINRVIKKNPHRKEILLQALYAHTQKCYALSVPTFLIQADGIMIEATGRSYFVSENRWPQVRKLFVRKGSDRVLDLTRPLQHHTPLNANERVRRERGYSDSILNRHVILHGLSTTYHNKEYSLKSISFLDLVDSVFS